jgi:arginyl-tRNA synthetase
MKQELISKLREIIDDLSSDQSVLAIEAEKCLDDQALLSFAELTVAAAESLEEAMAIVEGEGSSFSEDDIEELGAVAQAFDESGDPLLRKQASVLDEILISIGSNPKASEAFKKAQDDEIERLRAKYNKQKNESDVIENKEAKEAIKAIEEKVKRYKPLEAPLSTRYSPDMPGVMLVRIGDNVWQCPVTKKIFDFTNGYTTANGNKIPGTSVSEQSKLENSVQESMQFTSREDALNR